MNQLLNKVKNIIQNNKETLIRATGAMIGAAAGFVLTSAVIAANADSYLDTLDEDLGEEEDSSDVDSE